MGYLADEFEKRQQTRKRYQETIQKRLKGELTKTQTRNLPDNLVAELIRKRKEGSYGGSSNAL